MDKNQHLATDKPCGVAGNKTQVFVGHALAPEHRSMDLDRVRRETGQPNGACRVEDSFGSWTEADC